MAIEFEDMQLLKKINADEKFEGRLLILGDCVCHFKCSDIHPEYVENNVLETLFKKQFNFSSIDTVDITGRPTILHDLTEPFLSSFQQYDFIIDAGTIFHCFDVASALKNVNDMLKVGGRIFHISALSGFYGRGYFNLHPKFYHDFYLLNGYAIENMWLRNRLARRNIFNQKQDKWQPFNFSGHFYNGESFSNKLVKDVSKLPNNMTMAVLAKKESEKSIQFPNPKNMGLNENV